MYVCVCVRARACVSTAVMNTHTCQYVCSAVPEHSNELDLRTTPLITLTRKRVVFKLRTIFSSYLAENKVREHYKDHVLRNNQYSVWDLYQTNTQHGQIFSFWRLLLVTHTVTTGNTAIFVTSNPCSLHFRGRAKALTALILGHALQNLQSTAYCQWATRISMHFRLHPSEVFSLRNFLCNSLEYWNYRKKIVSYTNSNRKNGKHVKMAWTCSTHGLSQ
jgi:hypothetical protein